MSIWGRIFGSEKVIEAGASAIDKIWHTDEEKSDAHQNFLKLYEPYKLAQRVVATMVVGSYCFAWLVTFFADYWVDVTSQQKMLEGDMGTAAMMIVGFYFAGGVANIVRSK